MPYVDWMGDWSHPQPAAITDAEIYILPITLPDSDLPKLQAICDSRYSAVDGRFNLTPWKIPVLDRYLLLLVFADFPFLRSTTMPHADRGYIQEKDVGIFFPATMEIDGADHGLVAVNSCLFVDSWVGLLNGRETFGFPKVLADIGWNSPRLEFSVDTLVWDPYAASTPATPGRVLELTWETPWWFPSSLFSIFGSVVEEVLTQAAGASPIVSLARAILEAVDAPSASALVSPFASVRLPLLKQFREVSPGPGSDHQAVVQAEFAITNLTAVSVYPRILFQALPLHLHLGQFASLDLREYGLRPGDFATSLFRIRCDLELTGSSLP